MHARRLHLSNYCMYEWSLAELTKMILLCALTYTSSFLFHICNRQYSSVSYQQSQHSALIHGLCICIYKKSMTLFCDPVPPGLFFFSFYQQAWEKLYTKVFIKRKLYTKVFSLIWSFFLTLWPLPFVWTVDFLLSWTKMIRPGPSGNPNCCMQSHTACQYPLGSSFFFPLVISQKQIAD